jgi:hypothetical protein
MLEAVSQRLLRTADAQADAIYFVAFRYLPCTTGHAMVAAMKNIER